MGGMIELASGVTPVVSVLGIPLSLVLGWWAHKRATRKQTDDVSLAVVKDLRQVVELQSEQIKALNKGAEDERRVCEARIDKLEETRRADQADARRREDGLAHKLHNVEMNFDSLLLAIEVAPEKAAEVVTKIKGRRRVTDEAA